jgi:hypothetical protein
VVYQPYETGKIRWRYGTEPWQEIIGAGFTYSTEIVQNLTQNTSYQLVYESPIVSNGILQGWTNVESKQSLGTRNGISAWSVTFVDWKGTYNGKLQHSNAGSSAASFPPAGQRYVTVYLNLTTGNGLQTVQINTTLGLWALRIEQTNAALRSTSCKFKIFKNGVEVRSETRSTCPQVEVIPCSLSPNKKAIKVKKFRYLDRVEVVPYAYDVRWGLITDTGNYGLLLAKKEIPAECLNVYNNGVTSTIPTNFGNIANTPEQLYLLQAQICSAPGCPPPVYDVICDCQCEKCPDYTCPIECGDFICCYNDYGVSVQTIPKDKYCGGSV